MTIRINGIDVSDMFPGGIISNCSISSNNNETFINGKKIEHGKVKDGILKIKVEGSLVNLTSDCSVECGNVTGNIKAGNSVNCENVGGSIEAGNSINCENVKGNVKAGNQVNYTGK